MKEHVGRPQALAGGVWSRRLANAVVCVVLGTYGLLLLRLGINCLHMMAHVWASWAKYFAPVIIVAEFFIGYDRIAFLIVAIGLPLTLVLAIVTLALLKSEGTSLWTRKRVLLAVLVMPLLLPLCSELKMLVVTRGQLAHECELSIPKSARIHMIVWVPRFTGSEITRGVRLSMAKSDVQAFFAKTNWPLDDDWQEYGCSYDRLVCWKTDPNDKACGFLPGTEKRRPYRVFAEDELYEDGVYGLVPDSRKKYLYVEWDPVACQKANGVIEFDDSDQANLYLYVWVMHPR